MHILPWNQTGKREETEICLLDKKYLEITKIGAL